MNLMWNFVKKQLPYRIILPGLLGCSLFFAFSIRTSNVTILESQYLLGTDSYRFLRQADIIASQGKLPERDQMRWNPLGRDLSTHLSLWSYVIANSYRLLHIVYPELTVYQVARYSGLICYLACLLLLYLLWTRIFDASVALLAVNLLAVFPSFALSRSCAGNADRDAFSLLLWIGTVYFYILASDSPRMKGRLYAFISGIIAGILALSWEGSGLANATIASWVGLRLLRNRFDRRDVLIYSVWYLCLVSIATIFTKAYRDWLLPSAFVAITFPTAVWLSSLTFWVLQKARHWTQIVTFNHRISSGVVSAVCGGIGGFLLMAVFALVQPLQLGEALQLIFDNFVSPLGRSRLMRTVAELQSLTGESLVRYYSLVIIAGIVGSALLAYRFLSYETANFALGLIGFEIILCGLIVSLFPPEKIANPIYYLALAAGGITILISYILGRREPKGPATAVNSDKILWVLIWFFIAAASSRQAKRYIFFLDPVITVAVSYVVIKSLRRFMNRQTNLPVELCFLSVVICSEFYVGFHYALWPDLPQGISLGMVLIGIFLTTFLIRILQRHKIAYRNQAAFLSILFVLMLAMSSDTFQEGLLHASVNVASQTGPIKPHLQEAFAGITNYTDEDSVIAAWWGYGSMLNQLGKRRTVIDEDHYIPYWIYMMGRHVFAAQSEKEALEFLYAHGASHLLITTFDLYTLFLITYTGSDAGFDRLASITPLQPVVSQKVSAEEINTDFVPLRFRAVDSFLLDGTEYLPGEWSIKQVSVVHNQSLKRWHTVLHGIAGGKPFSKPPQVFQFKEHLTRTKKGVPGSIVAFPGRNNKMLQVLYLSEKARNLLAVRLYLFQEAIPGFSPVYDTNSILPCEADGLRLWKIDYPPDMSLRTEYLETEFPSEGDLRKSWRRGNLNGDFFSTR